MSQALTRTPDGEQKGKVFSHPLFVNIFTPIILAVIFGALTVYVTQANALLRLSTVEAAVEQSKKEQAERIDDLKSQIVPREEHRARWEAIEKRLEAIEKSGSQTSQRVDDIFKILTEGIRR